MPRILLPTIELPGARGGIARYIDAIAKTIPDVEVAPWSKSRSVESKGYDAVWVHHVLPIGTQAWLQRLRGGTPYVVFLHGMDFDLARRNVWKRFLTRRILRGATRVVTNSRALAGEVAAFADIPMPMVVYPCVSDDMVAAAAIPPSHHPPSTTLRLLTVGRLVERKGHMKVLDAIADMPDVTYAIVGDGPMRGAITRRIEELGLRDRVTLHADVADDALPEYYRNADVFVMPASQSAGDREGFGIVYLEANLFGLPVIACKTPGVDEAVVDGETGVLIDDTPVALRDALSRFSHDREFSVTLGQQGRERVLADFTRETQFATLRALL